MIVEASTTASGIPPAAELFASDLLAGFRQAPKRISCKYLYDSGGSALFEEICGLEEYYLTRAEQQILSSCAGEISDLAGERCALVELGSGSSRKTRVLLDRLDISIYVPVDIARRQLCDSAAELARSYPLIEVLPVCADYTRPFALRSPMTGCRNHLVFFPGSTIGNFEPSEAVEFLRRIATLCEIPGGMLIGVDLEKNPGRIEAAYNDRRQVTASFNLNLLHRANRELNANFDPTKFEHRAVYNREESRLEMRLISRADQIVRIVDELLYISDGEEIVTEHSYKYSISKFENLVVQSGLKVSRVWTDPAGFFSMWYLTCK